MELLRGRSFSFVLLTPSKSGWTIRTCCAPSCWWVVVAARGGVALRTQLLTAVVVVLAGLIVGLSSDKLTEGTVGG